jgi:amino acid transporter
VASSLTPPARTIDPRGQRFGAGVSVVILVVAFVTGWFWLAALVGLNLLVASAFGSRLFLPGRPWPIIRQALKLGPTEPEHEYPPRFAQALGGIFIALGALAYIVGLTPVGWLLVGAVAALQTLLAATGYCVGCKLYFLRWWVPSQFAKLFRRQDQRLGIAGQPLQRVS